MKIILPTLLVMLLFTRSASCETPEELVLRSAKMISEQGMESMAKITNPDDLASFRKEVAPKITKLLDTVDGRVTYWRYPKTKTEREKLTNEEFFEKFIQTVLDQRRDYQDRLGTYHKAKIVGSVQEGDVSHVIVRVPISVIGQEVETLEIISVKPKGGKPYLAMAADIAAAAQVILPE